jgi:hypothetical protein
MFFFFIWLLIYLFFLFYLLFMIFRPLRLNYSLLYVHRLWLWLWYDFGHVGIALVPLDSAKAWMLNEWPISRIAFNALLSEYVSDEKWEWQSPCSCRLSHSAVHSLPEFIYLSPNDLRNGAPKVSVERI